jgi:predicted transglutaminase-like cysteine proteinase
MDHSKLKSTLESIHDKVFESFRYVTDAMQYGLEEKWSVPPEFSERMIFKGDCDDFAMMCRKLCREAGIDNSRLLVCYTENGEGHLVLEVEGYVLDNRSRKLETKDTLTNKDYKWVAISGYNPGDQWTGVN